MSLLPWWNAWAALLASVPSGAPRDLQQPILPNWFSLNVTTENSRDPATERAIVSQHSYGRQIGTMMDVLELLVDRLEPEEKRADSVQRFDELRSRIAHIKEQALQRRLGSMCADLQALRAQHGGEAHFEQLAAQLRAVLDGPKPKRPGGGSESGDTGRSTASGRRTGRR